MYKFELLIKSIVSITILIKKKHVMPIDISEKCEE